MRPPSDSRQPSPGEWLRWYLATTVSLLVIFVIGLALWPWGLAVILVGFIVVAYFGAGWIARLHGRE
jgi:hypothetical protein